ncbi:MAG TPA: AAA family ATPase [Pseudomonadales bacterium]|nr:AAA family ATPase [Pseudomonadales bacterium]
MSIRFVVLFGPPAVGKMTVGREIERATRFRLFHNHMAIEPVLPFFAFGTPEFVGLVDGFRTRLIEAVAASDLPGMTFTFVWDFDNPNDANFLERLCRPFIARGDGVAFVELVAPLDVRLVRNRGADRLAEKASKRNVAWSEANVRDHERYRLDSGGTIPLPHRYVRIDNAQLSAREAADRTIDALGLVRTNADGAV